MAAAVGGIVGGVFGGATFVILVLLAIWGIKEYKKIRNLLPHYIIIYRLIYKNFFLISEVKKRSISPEISDPSESSKVSSLLSRLLHTTENRSHKLLKEEPDRKKPTRLPPLNNNKSYLNRSITPEITLPNAQNY